MRSVRRLVASDDHLDPIAAGVADASGDSLRSRLLALGLGPDTGTELRPRSDPELLVDTGEVRLHGLRADECGVGHLPIGHPGRRQLRDPAFRYSELVGVSMPKPQSIDLADCTVRPRR